MKFVEDFVSVIFGGTIGIALRIVLIAAVFALVYWIAAKVEPYLKKIIKQQSLVQRSQDQIDLKNENKLISKASKIAETLMQKLKSKYKKGKTK